MVKHFVHQTVYLFCLYFNLETCSYRGFYNFCNALCCYGANLLDIVFLFQKSTPLIVLLLALKVIYIKLKILKNYEEYVCIMNHFGISGEI